MRKTSPAQPTEERAPAVPRRRSVSFAATKTVVYVGNDGEGSPRSACPNETVELTPLSSVPNADSPPSAADGRSFPSLSELLHGTSKSQMDQFAETPPSSICARSPPESSSHFNVRLAEDLKESLGHHPGDVPSDPPSEADDPPDADVPMFNDDVVMYDVPMKNDEVPLKNDEVPTKNDDVPRTRISTRQSSRRSELPPFSFSGWIDRIDDDACVPLDSRPSLPLTGTPDFGGTGKSPTVKVLERGDLNWEEFRATLDWDTTVRAIIDNWDAEERPEAGGVARWIARNSSDAHFHRICAKWLDSVALPMAKEKLNEIAEMTAEKASEFRISNTILQCSKEELQRHVVPILQNVQHDMLQSDIEDLKNLETALESESRFFDEEIARAEAKREKVRSIRERQEATISKPSASETLLDAQEKAQATLDESIRYFAAQVDQLRARLQEISDTESKLAAITATKASEEEKVEADLASQTELLESAKTVYARMEALSAATARAAAAGALTLNVTEEGIRVTALADQPLCTEVEDWRECLCAGEIELLPSISEKLTRNLRKQWWTSAMKQELEATLHEMRMSCDVPIKTWTVPGSTPNSDDAKDDSSDEACLPRLLSWRPSADLVSFVGAPGDALGRLRYLVEDLPIDSDVVA